MKKLTILTLVIFHYSCMSQKSNSDELLLTLGQNLNRLEFTKLILFPDEIITICGDTAFQTKFAKKLNLHHQVIRKTVEDRQEYYLVLHMLYLNVLAQKPRTTIQREGRGFLLDLLKDYKLIDLEINEKFVMTQLDGDKRGMINGYDEGTVEESKFLIICVDPILFKKALLANDQMDKWARTGVFLCNYLRDNEIPMTLRTPLRDRVLGILTLDSVKPHYEEVLVDLIMCDISSNLND